MSDRPYWCEICARKKECYGITLKPKCFVPTADRKTEPQTSGIPYKIETSSVCKDEPQRTCEECKHYLFTDIDGYYCEHETYGQPCGYEPKDEPQTEVETMSCEECKHYVYQLGCTHHGNCAYEPQTETGAE